MVTQMENVKFWEQLRQWKSKVMNFNELLEHLRLRLRTGWLGRRRPPAGDPSRWRESRGSPFLLEADAETVA